MKYINDFTRCISVFVFGLALSGIAQVTASEIPENMVLIKEGDYVLGSNKTDDAGRGKEFANVKPWFLDEHPKHISHLPSFYIDKYEVTNEQFRDFVKTAQYEPPKEWLENGYLVSMKADKLNKLSVNKLRNLVADFFRIDIDSRKMTKEQLITVIHKFFDDLGKLPVTNVSWFDADKYCKHIGKSLPTEAQWEAATRGNKGNEFPWGNNFRFGITNTGEQDWPYGVAPVGSYPEDKSNSGVFDLAGNVSEWVADWYDGYEGGDYKSDAFGKKYKVFKGAAWGGSGHYALQHYQRGAYRLYASPDVEYEDLGFRCVQAVN